MQSPAIYISNVADCVSHPSGTVRLATDVGPLEVTKLPFIDRRSGLFARLPTPDAMALLEQNGMRLLTEAEWLAIVRLIRARGPGRYASGPDAIAIPMCNQTPDAMMRSLATQEKHDACVWRHLANWDGRSFVLNVGKQLLEPRKAKMSTNYGWFPILDAAGRLVGAPNFNAATGMVALRPVQPPGNAHELLYTDYSQVTTGVRV